MLLGSRFQIDKFFRLSCMVVSVGNKVITKIYCIQVNRMVASSCPQENTNFSLFDPVFPGVKFGSFFQNSYRSNDLTMFGLSCLVISVGNMFRSKIYPSQENRRSCPNMPQESMNFPHLGLKVPNLKFGSFFQNSYRSNDLTNS